jgi:hypothetical protein
MILQTDTMDIVRDSFGTTIFTILLVREHDTDRHTDYILNDNTFLMMRIPQKTSLQTNIIKSICLYFFFTDREKYYTQYETG